ncbi:MAG: ferrochelatase [Gemmatimonadetes bacterium]|nr:ferrochelatase [Gemmatimonadota bacterium]
MSVHEAPFGVLLVAYGAPVTVDDVEPYLLDVRGGRPTSPEMVTAFQQRYQAIGGGSPLLDRTNEQAAALAGALGGTVPVYVGMRHWHPYIRDVFQQVRADRVTRVVALALAPHFSTISVGAYAQRIEEARGDIATSMVRQWFDHPGFLDAVAERVREGLRRFPAGVRDEVTILFTAHSLPERILADGDPYEEQLRASVAGVLSRIGPRHRPHRFAYQSAGQAGGPWLGPDAADVIQSLAAAGSRHLLVCPIGFVSDHLEVLYDVDIEYRRLAAASGIQLERTASLNASPLLIEALAALVEEAARAEGWAA